MDYIPLAVELIVDWIRRSILGAKNASTDRWICHSLLIKDELNMNSLWVEIHRITNQVLELKRFENEIKEINVIYIYVLV